MASNVGPCSQSMGCSQYLGRRPRLF
jgi:hypothetical protein